MQWWSKDLEWSYRFLEPVDDVVQHFFVLRQLAVFFVAQGRLSELTLVLAALARLPAFSYELSFCMWSFLDGELDWRFESMNDDLFWDTPWSRSIERFAGQLKPLFFSYLALLALKWWQPKVLELLEQPHYEIRREMFTKFPYHDLVRKSCHPSLPADLVVSTLSWFAGDDGEPLYCDGQDFLAMSVQGVASPECFVKVLRRFDRYMCAFSFDSLNKNGFAFKTIFKAGEFDNHQRTLVEAAAYGALNRTGINHKECEGGLCTGHGTVVPPRDDATLRTEVQFLAALTGKLGVSLQPLATTALTIALERFGVAL
ncbi:hypothetical protein H9P43_009066 [Blastocladiella emersonii ATCC 22665]|nr:hypothetical protein H9P43_009066 [Blastocladiella emersonii ATCC 22665]